VDSGVCDAVGTWVCEEVGSAVGEGEGVGVNEKVGSVVGISVGVGSGDVGRGVGEEVGTVVAGGAVTVINSILVMLTVTVKFRTTMVTLYTPGVSYT